jgi:chromosome segregation ATPase
MEVGGDPDSEWPDTPQRGDVVDKLLKKLLPKPPVREDHSHEGVLGSGGVPAHSTAGSYEPKKPRVARVAQQLASAREALKSAGVPSDAACRVAALEAKLYQLETDTVAAVAAKRRAEHDLIATKSQLSTVTKSLSLQKADWEQAVDFLRSQVESKSQEAARLDQYAKKQAAQLAQLQQESERQQESASAAQKRLRERVAVLERQADEAKESLRAAEGHVATVESTRKSLLQSKSGLEEENSRLKERVESLKKDVGALREELSAAREQLESALLRATGSREAEEALRDAVAQRAAATQENRSLRGEVCRLQSALLEEKAAREQLKHKAELKLTAATHEATALREKLEAKVDETKASKAIIASLKADADRAKDAHEAVVDSLKEKLVEGRRAAEETRRRTAEEMQEAEARWEEKTDSAISQAVARHQRRIQDLELQLAHQSGGGAGSSGIHAATNRRSAVPRGSSDSLYNNGPPGGYAASILDYIPRAEHLRLLECRTAAREAEAKAEVAAVKAAAVAEGQSRVAAVTQELQEAKNKLHKAVVAEAEQQERAARAEQKVTMLRAQCSETIQQLAKAKEENGALGNKVAQLEKEVQKQLGNYEKATLQAAEALEIEKTRGDKACAGLEVAVAAAKASEETAKKVETRRLELEFELKEKIARCDALSNHVSKLQNELSKAEEATAELQRTAAATAERARTLQERCVITEQERDTLQTQLQNLKIELEQAKNAAIAFREESTRKAQAEMSSLLSRIETSLGMPTHGDQHQNTVTSIESRVEMVLSKCRQQQTETATSLLAAQRAEQESLTSQARQVALEQHYLQAQQQYIADMASLERAAREQVKGVKNEAEEAIAGLRRASTLLHEQVTRNRTTTTSNGSCEEYAQQTAAAFPNFLSTTNQRQSQRQSQDGGVVERAGSLASEVEELKQRLAQQAQQADAMEKQEQAFASLLSQLTQRLNNGNTAGGVVATGNLPLPAAGSGISIDATTAPATLLHSKKQA